MQQQHFSSLTTSLCSRSRSNHGALERSPALTPFRLLLIGGTGARVEGPSETPFFGMKTIHQQGCICEVKQSVFTIGDEERRLSCVPASVGKWGEGLIMSADSEPPGSQIWEYAEMVKTPLPMNNNNGRVLQGIPEEEPESHPWY